jgi:hypothetical protein
MQVSFFPLFRFLGFHGQNAGLFLTAISTFRLSWAECRSLSYRYFDFWAFMGRMQVSFLPLFRLLGFCGQNRGTFFTAFSIFRLLRVEWWSLSYRYFDFWAFAGRMEAPFFR